MATVDQYKTVLSDLIQKQMVMLGPNVALGTARKVAGLTVGDNGVVTDITGDPQTVMSGIAQAYMNLSGQIAQNTLESILAKYPDIKTSGS